VLTTVDAAGDTGWAPSLALDSGGAVHVAYRDYGDQEGDLWYATNESGAWVLTTVDAAGDTGWGPSLALDSGGAVHIAYTDGTNGDLRYARPDCP
jgi:hypothetical protein